MFFINAARVGVLEARALRQRRKIERQAADITRLLQSQKDLRAQLYLERMKIEGPHA